MIALFGEGRHPNADQIERDAQLAAKIPQQVDQASRLGAPYRIHEQANVFHRRSAGAFRVHCSAQYGWHASVIVRRDGSSARTPWFRASPSISSRLGSAVARSLWH